MIGEGVPPFSSKDRLGRDSNSSSEPELNEGCSLRSDYIILLSRELICKPVCKATRDPALKAQYRFDNSGQARRYRKHCS